METAVRAGDGPNGVVVVGEDAVGAARASTVGSIRGWSSDSFVICTSAAHDGTAGSGDTSVSSTSDASGSFAMGDSTASATVGVSSVGAGSLDVASADVASSVVASVPADGAGTGSVPVGSVVDVLVVLVGFVGSSLSEDVEDTVPSLDVDVSSLVSPCWGSTAANGSVEMPASVADGSAVAVETGGGLSTPARAVIIAAVASPGGGAAVCPSAARGGGPAS